ARVEVALLPVALLDAVRLADVELRVRALELHRELACALLDLAAEELLERGVVAGVAAGELREDAERVRGEHLGLDAGLRDLPAQRREVGAAARGALQRAAIHVRERMGAVLQADLEVERPQRPALVRERGANQRPAAVHLADDVLDRDA